MEPYIPYIYLQIAEDDRAGLKPDCTLAELEDHIRSLDRVAGTLADAIGAQGAFKIDSNRRMSIQYAVYKKGLKQVQAETLAWKLFQEVLPHDVNMYTVQVSGDAEPDAG